MPTLNNNPIISNKESSLLDKQTVKITGIPSAVLMEEASERLFSQLKLDFDIKNNTIGIIAGWGNNGGDALSVARKLYFEGIIADIYIFPDKTGSELYETHCKILKSLSIPLLDIKTLTNKIDDYTLLIDGIFGIGYHYRENEFMMSLFGKINNSPATTVSIDVPSGLVQDKYPCINADYTYSVGFLKQLFYSINTRKFCGVIRDLKISFEVKTIKKGLHSIFIDINDINLALLKHSNFVHKYSRGGTITIGAGRGKLGALLFASEAALNSGSGIVLGLSEDDCVSHLQVMSKKIIFDSIERISHYIDKYRSIVIGPGLNCNEASKAKITKLFREDKQFILDASFFTIFKKNVMRDFKRPPILTPHTQEFKYFFEEERDNITSSTLETLSRTASRYKAYIVLKDSFIAIGTPAGEVYVIDNPIRIMAQAGSGDILAGIIGGISAQQIHSPLQTIIKALDVFYSIANQLALKSSYSYNPTQFLDLIIKEIGNEA